MLICLTLFSIILLIVNTVKFRIVSLTWSENWWQVSCFLYCSSTSLLNLLSPDGKMFQLSWYLDFRGVDQKKLSTSIIDSILCFQGNLNKVSILSEQFSLWIAAIFKSVFIMFSDKVCKNFSLELLSILFYQKCFMNIGNSYKTFTILHPESPFFPFRYILMANSLIFAPFYCRSWFS